MLDLRCRFGFHDYDYFSMTRLDGGTEHHRCCLRCEKSQLVWWEDAESFANDDDLALLNSDAAQAKARQEQGRENLLALFGVKKKSAADI